MSTTAASSRPGGGDDERCTSSSSNSSSSCSSNSSSSSSSSDHNMPPIPKLTIKPVPLNPKTTASVYGTNSNEFINNNYHHHKIVTSSNSNHQQQQPQSSPKPSVEHQLSNTSSATTTAADDREASHSQDLQVCTSSSGSGSGIIPASSSVGPQSPRIILKINVNQNSVVSTNVEPRSSEAALAAMSESLAKRRPDDALLKRHLLLQDSSIKRAKRTPTEDGDRKADDEPQSNSVPSVASAPDTVPAVEVRVPVLVGTCDTTTLERADPLAVNCVNTNSNSNDVNCTIATTKDKPKKAMVMPHDGGNSTTSNKSNNNSSCKNIVPKDKMEEEEVDEGAHERMEEVEVVLVDQLGNVDTDDEQKSEEEAAQKYRTPPMKRGRGRPRKTPGIVKEQPLTKTV